MSTGYRIQASTGIHRGDRDYQQDQVCMLQHQRHTGCLLAVVADGMGGRSGGRKASDQVMLTARQLFERYDPETDDPAAFLRQIVEESHLVIKLTAVSAEQEPHSTIAAFLVNPGGDSHWVHAGDSRIYHFRHGKMVFRTMDHSYVQTLVNQGEISEEEAHGPPTLEHPDGLPGHRQRAAGGHSCGAATERWRHIWFPAVTASGTTSRQKSWPAP